MAGKYIFGRNKCSVTMCDGVLGSGCYPKNTVTIDTLRHGPFGRGCRGMQSPCPSEEPVGSDEPTALSGESVIVGYYTSAGSACARRKPEGNIWKEVCLWQEGTGLTVPT